MIRVIDYKPVEMTDQEWEYYNYLVKEFTELSYDGKEQFHDMFDTTDDGVITMVRTPFGKEISWSVWCFLINLMINQRMNNMEMLIKNNILEGSKNVR